MNKKIIGGCVLGAVIILAEAFVMLDYKDKYETADRMLAQSAAKEQAISASANKMLDSARIVEQIVEQNYLYDIDTKTMKDGLLTGMLWGLGDPYAAYYDADSYERMTIQSTGEYSGIGAVLTEQEDGTVTIVKLYPNSPSAEAGLKPQDVFYAIDGTYVVGEDSSTIASMLKGLADTEVEVEIYRPSIDEYITVTMKRKTIEIPSLSYRMLDEKIGLLQIDSWDLATVNQFYEAMDALTNAGMQKLIIDVRNNPGGIVQAASDILDYFVEDGGKLVYTIDKNDKEVDYLADDGMDSDIKLVVLVNGNSASASEIFAGGIKDYQAGTLVGEKTYGKGIVQQVFPISDTEAVKLTIAEYYLPGGECIHKKGIEPDVKVSLSEEALQKATLTDEEDAQLMKAMELLKE